MKQSITLQLKMSEIIYDIQNKTYLTGRSALNDSNHSHVANMQANDDDENAAQILRSITTAFSVLRNSLAEYIESADPIATNDTLTEKDDLSISLEMPSNFNGAATKTLGELIHRYLVSSAIAEWFAITAKDETTDYSAVAANSLAIIREALSKRSRPKRS